MVNAKHLILGAIRKREVLQNALALEDIKLIQTIALNNLLCT